MPLLKRRRKIRGDCVMKTAEQLMKKKNFMLAGLIHLKKNEKTI
jgi:hypothetical protein